MGSTEAFVDMAVHLMVPHAEEAITNQGDSNAFLHILHCNFALCCNFETCILLNIARPIEA